MYNVHVSIIIYHIFICIIPLWCIKIDRSNRAVKGLSLQFNTDSRSQLCHFSYKLRMLSTPNGLNYLMSICILQFNLIKTTAHGRRNHDLINKQYRSPPVQLLTLTLTLTLRITDQKPGVHILVATCSVA